MESVSGTESEALKAMRVHLELIKALKGSEDWETLGAGLNRIADLFGQEMASRNTPGVYQTPAMGSIPVSVDQLKMMHELARELYPDDPPEVGVRKVRTLMVELGEEVAAP